MNLQGKKLLILGGNSKSKDIVIAAKEAGMYTIVTDWYDTQRSPAKLIADEYWNEEIFQPERIAQLITERKVDGVITGYTDSYLLQYQLICELANKPCYATKEIFEITLNKSKFKHLCRQNNVPVVPEYNINEIDKSSISSENKIIIKPVDNSGSRGIIICDNPINFEYCIDYALSFSEKKEVIIEKYLNHDTFSASYTIQDGIISLSTMNDRIVHKAHNAGAVTAGGIYPSKYLDTYLLIMDERVKNMYKNLGVKNGVLFIQGFANGKDFFFYEMGYRLSGGQHYIYTKHHNNTSSLEQLIHFAITGKMADYCIADIDNPKFKVLSCEVNILGKEGKIARIEGIEYLKSLPEVINFSLLKNIGDIIGKDGTTSQMIAGMHLILNNTADLERILLIVKNNFKVFDEADNNLVLELLK